MFMVCQSFNREVRKLKQIRMVSKCLICLNILLTVAGGFNLNKMFC